MFKSLAVFDPICSEPSTPDFPLGNADQGKGFGRQALYFESKTRKWNGGGGG